MAMVKKPFNGQLNTNSVYATIFNMIINQFVHKPSLANNYNEFNGMFTVDAGLYGDTILSYAQDIGETEFWLGHDAEAVNLLDVKRAADPKCQATSVDTYRKVWVSTDRYLTKQAWSTENAFQQFQDNVIGLLKDAKEIQRTTMLNVLIGTYDSSATRGTVEFDITTAVGGATGLDAKMLTAEAISEEFSNLDVELKDYNRDFNEYGFLRSYNSNDLIYIGNAKWLNKMSQNVRTIYHEAGMLDKLTAHVLPARYFGHKVTSSTIANYVYDVSTNPTGELDESSGVYTVHTGIATVRALDEGDFTDGVDTIHVRGGDVIPAGYIVEAGNFYVEDADIICKVLTKDSIKFLDGFEVETEFWNPRGLITNNYIIYGYSNVNDAEDQCVMKDAPFLTIKAV